MKHRPIFRTCQPEITILASILVPPLDPSEQNLVEEFEEYAVGLSEWVGLVALNSSRTQASDSIDAYLSRYEVPSRDLARETNLIRVRWNGLLPNKWITHVLLECL